MRLHCSASSPVVYSGSLDGVVRVWDVRSGECVQQWYGHSDHILDITVARYVLSSPLSNINQTFTEFSLLEHKL